MPFCTRCGTAVSEGHRFCAQCGAALQGGQAPAAVEARTTASQAVSHGPVVPSGASPPPSYGDMTPRQGSILWTPGEPLGRAEATEGRRGTFIVVTVGVLLVLLVLSVVGYRAFTRAQSTSPAAAVEATEQLVHPPTVPVGGPQTPSSNPSVTAIGANAPAHAERVGDPRWTLIAEATRGTTNTDEALGPPDGKASVIAPGGRIALSADDEPFYNGPGVDVEVYGPGGKPVPYTIFARAEPEGRWVRFDVNRRGFPNAAAGHDMGHHRIRQARQIMIQNDGSLDLYIDAVQPRYRVPAGHDEPDTDPHRHK